ncbi:MAG: M3 family metallopeptidase [Thermoanaerobaculaceae bacterium]|nr:M3 family metallopeptidase [Thermoanaerobaculaceae bacterium]
MTRQTLPVVVLVVAVTAGAWGAEPGPQVDVPDYSQSERSAVPEAYRWRLEDIYPTVAAWQSEMTEVRRDLGRLELLLQGCAGGSRRLADGLELHESLARRLARLVGCASLRSQVQWSDARSRDMQGEANQLQVALDAQAAALDGCILQADETTLVEDPAVRGRLDPYRSRLQRVLAGRAHSLSADAAQVASRVGLFSDGSRVAAECLRDLDMPRAEVILPEGGKLPLTWESWRKLSGSPVGAERRAVAEAGPLNRKRFENTFAALLDTSVKRDLFQASIRRFPDCLSAELDRYGVPPALYRTMVQTVRGHLDPYHRFLRLRRSILGLQELHPYDDDLPTVPDQELRVGFDEARRLTEASLRPLGSEYASLVRQAFEARWFDVYGHRDRMSFGSAQSVMGVHPFIGLDYRGSYFDVITVTHELGHALSFHLAEQSQPFAANEIVWFASEIPSTFNEILLMTSLVEQAGDDRSKLAMLSQLLERINVLLFFDARYAELQLAMHEHVEAGGTLTPEWLNAKQLELARHYLGHDRGIMVVDEYVQSEWNHPSNYFSPFQGYFYVVGAVVSLALVDEVRGGGEAAARYMSFLKSGSSRPILEVLQEMGIDLSTPQPYLQALAAYDRLVGRMETLQARLQDRAK